MDTAISRQRLQTPIGELVAFASAERLCTLAFADGRYDPRGPLTARFGPVAVRDGDPLGVGDRFAAYFRGEWAALEDLPLDPGGTPFQQRGWAVLRTIPAGRTRSYLEVAREVGAADAVRAVGAANGRNPIAIVVPCHRVIGADGRLVGYGGGLDRKKWLLAHERAPLPAAALRQARLFE
jgi:methylated-DNA-[protein]-cysteine S-methyltransferase